MICVGNLTAGGTGKTPIAIAIARALIEREAARDVPHARLWRASAADRRSSIWRDDCAADIGDEPLLLAAAAPVIVSRDRAAGAQARRSASAPTSS